MTTFVSIFVETDRIFASVKVSVGVHYGSIIDEGGHLSSYEKIGENLLDSFISNI